LVPTGYIPTHRVAAGGVRSVVREVLATEASYAAASAGWRPRRPAARSWTLPRCVWSRPTCGGGGGVPRPGALRREPDNAALAQLLRHAHEQKLALLRRATRVDT
jgi:hypothetical protein